MTKLCPMRIIAKYYGPHHVGLCDSNRVPLCHALIHEDDFRLLFGEVALELAKLKTNGVTINLKIKGVKP